MTRNALRVYLRARQVLCQHGVPVVVQTLEAVFRGRLGHAANNRFSSSGCHVADTWPVPRVQHRVRVLLTCHHRCVGALCLKAQNMINELNTRYVSENRENCFYDSSSLIRKVSINFNIAVCVCTLPAGCWLLPWADTCDHRVTKHDQTNCHGNPAAKNRVSHWSGGGGGWDLIVISVK